jgi:hypothetical protein
MFPTLARLHLPFIGFAWLQVAPDRPRRPWSPHPADRELRRPASAPIAALPDGREHRLERGEHLVVAVEFVSRIAQTARFVGDVGQAFFGRGSRFVKDLLFFADIYIPACSTPTVAPWNRSC